MLSGRVIKINLLTGLIKRILLYKMSYHSKSNQSWQKPNKS